MTSKNKKAWDYYYDAMVHLGDGGDPKIARKWLSEAIKIYPDMVALYVGMSAVYRNLGNHKKEQEYMKYAYEKTKKKFPKWPKELSWFVLENRQYLRAICGQAEIYHIDGKKEKAEDLYKLIIKLNPSDNQGIRYLLAGFYQGLMPMDIDNLIDMRNRTQDWSMLEDLLNKQNDEHHFWKE